MIGRTNQDNGHHCYLCLYRLLHWGVVILSVRTGALGRCHLGKSTDYFWIMYLTELVFPSTSVIEQTPTLPIHPKTSQTHGCNHYDFHTVQSIYMFHLFSDFLQITHINFIHHTAWISSENIVWSHGSCILQCCLCRHHHTRCVSFFYDPVLQTLSMYAHLARS